MAALAGCVGGNGDDDIASDDDGDDDAETDDGAESTDDDDPDSEVSDEIDAPDDVYTGPDGSESDPEQTIGNWLVTINENDSEAYNGFLHSEYAWPEADEDEFADEFYLDDLTLELVDEDLEEEDVEDLRMFSAANSPSQSGVLEAAADADTAVVSSEGTTIEDGEESHTVGEYLLVSENGEWEVLL